MSSGLRVRIARKHSISQRLLPARVPIGEQFAIAGAAGFGAVEMTATTDRGEIAEVLSAMARTGVAVSAVNSRRSSRLDLAQRGDSLETSVEAILLALHNAADWGARTVLVNPGRVDASTSLESAWERTVEVIATRLLPTAEQLGVVLAVENIWGTCILTARDMAAFVDELGSPWFGAHFDVGNVIFGHPHHWIPVLGKRIVSVHYKDFRMTQRWGAGYFRFPMPGSGDIDWPRVDAAFAKVGFEGWFGHAGIEPPPLLRLVGRVDRLLEGRPGRFASYAKPAVQRERLRRHIEWLGEMGRNARTRDAALATALSSPVSVDGCDPALIQ